MLSSASEKKRCKAAGSGSSVVEKQLWKDRNMFCLQDNIANKTSVLWHHLRNDNLSGKLLWKILVARQLFPALPAQHSQQERKDHAPNSATAFRKKSQNMLRLQDSNPTVTLQSEDFFVSAEPCENIANTCKHSMLDEIVKHKNMIEHMY